MIDQHLELEAEAIEDIVSLTNSPKHSISPTDDPNGKEDGEVDSSEKSDSEKSDHKKKKKKKAEKHKKAKRKLEPDESDDGVEKKKKKKKHKKEKKSKKEKKKKKHKSKSIEDVTQSPVSNRNGSCSEKNGRQSRRRSRTPHLIPRDSSPSQRSPDRRRHRSPHSSHASTMISGRDLCNHHADRRREKAMRRSRTPPRRHRTPTRSPLVHKGVPKSPYRRKRSKTPPKRRPSIPRMTSRSRKESKSEDVVDISLETEVENEDADEVIEARRRERQKLLLRIMKEKEEKINRERKQQEIEEKTEVHNDKQGFVEKASENDDGDEDSGDSSSSVVSTSSSEKSLKNAEPEDFSFEELENEKRLHLDSTEKSLKLNETQEAVDDMFGATFQAPVSSTQSHVGKFMDSLDTGAMLDTWDDPEGYYRIRVGEKIDAGRYRVSALCGQGVFSNVVRASDIGLTRDVVIKIIRNNELMEKQGRKEVEMLRQLNDKDPHSKFHCIMLLRTFVHRKHLCLVFESMSCNLRDVLKRYGHKVGLHIKCVVNYAHQLFLALKHLRRCGILHSDIKPDNILVDSGNLHLKLADFGSAFPVAEASGPDALTPYLVSRYYRAPEIIVGLPYDFGLDMWSVGVTLFEMYTSRMCFPGKTNNHMLRLFQDLRGKLPNRLVRKAAFKEVHYDDQGNFLYQETDKVTRRMKVRAMPAVPLSRDLANDLLPASSKGVPPAQRNKVLQLKELLDQIFVFNTEKRLTAVKALATPFITEKL